MPEPDYNRDLDALVKAMEENREELKKTQRKVESLEAAIQALRASRPGSDRKGG
jgi:chromosome segregation ATPase